jgi:hypothetical protein
LRLLERLLREIWFPRLVDQRNSKKTARCSYKTRGGILFTQSHAELQQQNRRIFKILENDRIRSTGKQDDRFKITGTRVEGAREARLCLPILPVPRTTLALSFHRRGTRTTPLSLGRQVHQIPYWRAQDSNACRQDGVISYGYLVAGIDLLREPFSRGIVPSASRLGMMTAWILHQSGVQYWRPDRWLHRSRSEHLNCDTCELQDCAAPIMATRNQAKNRSWKGNT